MSEKDIDDILKILNIKKSAPFPDYFRYAIMHSSYANENGTESYERLEFFGDAIVGFVIAQREFEIFPNMKEGDLAKIKAVVGSEKILADVSKEIGLSKFVLVGKSLSSASLDELDSIYADTFESVMASVFINFGFEVVKDVISELLNEKIMSVAQKKLFFDYKTLLQEYTQEKFSSLPEYLMVNENGPAHKKNYVFEVKINGELYGTGKGKSKKAAEQLAAKMAYEKLNKR